MKTNQSTLTALKKGLGILLLLMIFAPLSAYSQTTITKTFTAPSSVSVDGCGSYCTVAGIPEVTFTSADFPAGCEISDVNVSITWAKTDGSCTTPGTGNSHHDEVNFRIDGPTSNVILVAPGTFTGNATISAVTTVLDQAAPTAIGGATPVSGTFRPNTGNLNTFNGTSALGAWRLRPGDTGTGDPLCITSYSVTITVVDDLTGPSITCPGNQTGNVDAACSFSLPDYTSLATATDLCGVTGITQSPAPGTNVGVGTTSVSLSASDSYGNISMCGFDVVVSDATAPLIACPGNQTGNADATCQFALPDYTGLATATDNCDASPAITQSPAPGTMVGVGTTTITLTATDASSNTDNCTFDVVVSDGTAPVVTCPGNQTGSVDAACQFTLPDYTGLATVTDNCDASPTVTQSPAPGTVVAAGTTTITLTATDASTNSGNCTFDVVVSDVTAPSITCPGNQTGNVDATCQFALPDYTGLATATDICDASPAITQSPAPGTMVGVGTTTITLTATDASSNTDNCTFDVVVSDATAPSITCPGNQTENADASCQASLPDYTGLATVTDNCDAAPTVTQSPAPGTTLGLGTVTVTLTATDASSNVSNCTFDVEVVDATAPMITCPGNQTGTADASCQYTLPDYTSLATATDNCDASPTVTQSPAPGTTVIAGTTTITLTATDASANSANCSFDVVVSDITAPSITCPGNQTENADASCQVTLPDYTALAVVSDNCDPSPAVTQSPAPGTVITATTTVTLTATDASANSANCTFDVAVVDVTAPVVVCPGNQTENADASCQVSLPDYTGMATVTDNCDASPVVTQSPVAGTILGVGTTTITLTATDVSGNSSNCTFDVVVVDATAPSITCPGNQTGIVDAACEFTLPDYTGLATASDNCDASPIVSQSPAAGTTLGVGTTTVTLTVTDASLNTTDCTFDVVISDTTSPTPDVATLTDLTDACSVTSLTAPTATDNCAGSIVGTHDATLPIDAQGTTVVTWSFDDGNGNVSTQTQNVIISDMTDPTASNPDTLFVDCIAAAPVDVTVVTDEVDNCSAPTVTWVADVSTGGTCADTITRTYNVADNAGNNIDVTQIIIVLDTIAPTASNPITLNVQCIGDVPAANVTWVTDESDNCGTPSVTWVGDASDGQSCPETITRTFAVTDDCGNTTMVDQMIIVSDIDAPVPDDTLLTELTGFCDLTPATPTATDNCDGVLTGVSDVTFPINTPGTTTVTWTYTDACGNVTTQTQDVTVESIDVSTWMASDGITIVSNNLTPGVTHQWIDCSAGNTPLTGETSHNFTPTYSSDFAVVVTQDGCTDTSACVTIQDVGLNELYNASFKIYPNPSTGIFKVEIDGVLTNIEIIDMLGRVVNAEISIATGDVNAAALEPGKYMVRVTTDAEQVFVQEIMIQQ